MNVQASQCRRSPRVVLLPLNGPWKCANFAGVRYVKEGVGSNRRYTKPVLLFLCFCSGRNQWSPSPTPRPLQCYHCISSKSWDDCDDVREVLSCSDDEEQSCAKLGLHGERSGETIQGYFRGCFDTSLCEDDNDCKFESDDESLTITKCDFSCCTEDLCNKAIAVPMISVITLLACALQAVLI